MEDGEENNVQDVQLPPLPRFTGKLYKISEVAAILSVSEASLRNWIRQGTIKAVKLPGGGYRIRGSMIDKLLETYRPNEDQ